MNPLHATRRILPIVIAVTLLACLALATLAGLALWRLTEWGRTGAQSVGETTRTLMTASREEALHALGQARDSVAQTQARAAEVLTSPEAVLQRSLDAAGEEVVRSVAAAAAAAPSEVAGTLSAVASMIETAAARDPAKWPTDLALTRISARRHDGVGEFRYVSDSARFPLAELRRQLVALGYEEHVIAEREGSLEALYRADRQLLLGAITRDGVVHLTVRDMPVEVPNGAGP